MITKQQLEKGLAEYLDTHVMPQIHETGWKRALVATGASIALKRVGSVIESYKTNPVLNALNVVDQDGNIDVEVVCDELQKNIPDEGITLNFGNINMRFGKEDVGDLYRCLMKQ